MSINLEKGAKVDLTKTNPSVKKFLVGLGWNTNAAVGEDFDLDVSAFIVGANDKLITDKHMVFYNELVSPNGFVTHSGDNRTGAGDGDDETLTVDFTKVLPADKKIIFVVTIHKAAERNQNFGQVSGAYIRIVDVDKQTAALALTDLVAQEEALKAAEIMKYDLNEDYSIETAVEFGAIYEKDGEWKFNAIGTGMKGGLADYVTKFS